MVICHLQPQKSGGAKFESRETKAVKVPNPCDKETNLGRPVESSSQCPENSPAHSQREPPSHRIPGGSAQHPHRICAQKLPVLGQWQSAQEALASGRGKVGHTISSVVPPTKSLETMLRKIKVFSNNCVSGLRSAYNNSKISKV